MAGRPCRRHHRGRLRLSRRTRLTPPARSANANAGVTWSRYAGAATAVDGVGRVVVDYAGYARLDHARLDHARLGHARLGHASCTLGLLAALAGAWAAARRAARVRPIEALRESSVDRRAMTPVQWVLGLASIAGAIPLAPLVHTPEGAAYLLLVALAPHRHAAYATTSPPPPS